METLKVNEIDSVKWIGSTVLQVQFNYDWSMEDCESLSTKLLMLTSAKLIERMQGADLHSIRLRYKSAELLLNFEEYSHSCWFECATELDSQALLAIEKIILQSIA